MHTVSKCKYPRDDRHGYSVKCELKIEVRGLDEIVKVCNEMNRCFSNHVVNIRYVYKAQYETINESSSTFV